MGLHELTDRGLQAGTVYSWAELGRRFGFAADYLGVAGGMISRPEQNALLLITHPGGARSFNYDDAWDGRDLIYTGRGKRGDQRYAGQNRDVGENARDLHVFEPAGVRALTYLGQATCVDTWHQLAPDLKGHERSVLRFRLRFGRDDALPGSKRSMLPNGQGSKTRSVVSRSFDPRRRPTPPRQPMSDRAPEEVARLHEKANSGHHGILVVLHAKLQAAGWSELEELRTAYDLWARDRAGQRVIFEAKTLRDGTQRTRVRAGLAQLLEYRYRYGSPDDRLCLVTDAALSGERTAFLEHLGIAVAVVHGNDLYAGSSLARRLLRAVLTT